MSVRAKIEAVIYAAEEPVTLAQLSLLFGAEALDERAVVPGEASLPTLAAQPGWVQGSSQSAALFENASEPTAEDAADAHAERPASDAAIEEAVEHPEQVSMTGPDGFAGEPEEEIKPNVEVGDADQALAGTERERRLARLRERAAREEIRRLVEELRAEYDRGDRGMELREIAGGYRVATKPEYHDAVRGFIKSLKPPMKLTLQALETLAVIAYKQPVTSPEVSEIRGVDSGGVMGSLISRKLVTTAGRKQVIGRPILYKTTKEFLLSFGLKDLGELPSMEEFEKMAGELVESEAPSQMELQAAETHAEQGETPVEESETADRRTVASAFPGQAEAAAPERTEAREEEELAARARASVQVDDEGASLQDLPGVTPDTAGRLNIDSRAHSPNGLAEDES